MKNLFLILFCAVQIQLAAQLKLPSIFSDNMVLQAQKEINIWGWASAGENISVEFRKQSKSIIANSNGEWIVKLSPENYGGPDDLKIADEENERIFKNVLVGEVWVCSGQSNMNMPLGGWGRVNNYKVEIENANYPKIRLYTVPLTLSEKPEQFVDAEPWNICTPETIENFSAVAYFYGRELFTKLNVPIGLIHVSKGGTPIESWMSASSLKEFPEFNSDIKFVEEGSATKFKTINDSYKKSYSQWFESIKENDPGFTSEHAWFDSSYNFDDWLTMEIPNVWEDQGLPKYDGVVWFKKVLNLPPSWIDQNLKICLGPVEDKDITYYNGIKIGEQKSKNLLSIYELPKELNTKSENVLTVRIHDDYGNGGIWGRENELYLENELGEKITLVGEWKYKPALQFDDNNLKVPERVLIDRKPTILFNGMISPITNFAARGFIWYQGESNGSRPEQYKMLFPKMISSWRNYWNDPEMPFYFVQLANYKAKSKKPSNSGWQYIRESQNSVLDLPNTGMAVTIDIGHPTDVHPKNKQEVGRRLALPALVKTYGIENLEYSGPSLENFEIINGEVLLSFKHAEGLKTPGNEKLVGFELAGQDSIFHKVDAKIQGDKVILKSDIVINPVAVRYGWAFNPDCNLYNSSNLPALPFRTDEW